LEWFLVKAKPGSFFGNFSRNELDAIFLFVEKNSNLFQTTMRNKTYKKLTVGVNLTFTAECIDLPKNNRFPTVNSQT